MRPVRRSVVSGVSFLDALIYPIYVCTTCVSFLQRPAKNIASSGFGVRGDCEPTVWVLGTKSSARTVFLAADSLSALPFLRICVMWKGQFLYNHQLKTPRIPSARLSIKSCHYWLVLINRPIRTQRCHLEVEPLPKWTNGFPFHQMARENPAPLELAPILEKSPLASLWSVWVAFVRLWSTVQCFFITFERLEKSFFRALKFQCIV